MASGSKRIGITTLERAASTDILRMQRFLDAQVAESMRWLLAASMGEGANSSVGSTTTDPLGGVILNGLWARPEVGTVNLFIEPGMAGLVNPDASPNADDSPFKLVLSAGQQTAGALTLTPGGGGTRIDVIEMRRVETVIETTSRDIFNPTTGVFAPALVNKVVQDVLEFRIRLGTPGAGWPGTASGWLPLAVASVPNTATTWNDVTVWDVRPLVGDRVRGPAQTSQTFPIRGRHWWSIEAENVASSFKLSGVCESSYAGWLMGGEIGPSNSGLTDGELTLDGSDVQEPGFVAVADRPVYLYALAPFGLPRWAKYSPSSSGSRVPMSFRGIPVFSMKAPGGHNGVPGSAVSLPTVLGFSASTQLGVALLATNWSASSQLAHAHGIGDGWTHVGKVIGDRDGIVLVPSAGAGTSNATYELEDGVTHPVGATALRVRLQTTFGTPITAPATSTRFVTVGKADATVLWNKHMRSPISGDFFEEVEVPLVAPGALPDGDPVVRPLVYNTAGAGATWSAQRLTVIGWRMGM
jgi:hypothetical protein